MGKISRSVCNTSCRGGTLCGFVALLLGRDYVVPLQNATAAQSSPLPNYISTVGDTYIFPKYQKTIFAISFLVLQTFRENVVNQLLSHPALLYSQTSAKYKLDECTECVQSELRSV